MASLNEVSIFSAPSRGKTVFVDTNLDTHLVTLLHNGDTVSSFKKRLLEEHRLCFPDVGDIEVSALKVKRRGHFYHLSDTMFVTKAFDGISKSWFLFLEATKVKVGENLQLQCVDSSKQLECLTNGIERLLDGPSRRLPGIDELVHQQDSDHQLVKYKSSVYPSDAEKQQATNIDMAAEHGSGNHPDVCSPDTDAVIENVATECQSSLAAADHNNSDPKLLEKEKHIATTAVFADGSTKNEVKAVQQDPNLKEHAGTEVGTVSKRTRKPKRKTRSSDDHGLEGTHGPSVVSELTSANNADENAESNADKASLNEDGNANEVKAVQQDQNLEGDVGTELATVTKRTRKPKRKDRSLDDHALEETHEPSVVSELASANNTESSADKAIANVDGNVNAVKAVQQDPNLAEASGTELATITKRTHKSKRKVRSSDDHVLEGANGPPGASALISANNAQENTESNADKVYANVNGEGFEHRYSATPVAIEPSVIIREIADIQVNSIEAGGDVSEHKNKENPAENVTSVKETSSLQTPARKRRKVDKKPRKEDSVAGSVEPMLNTNKTVSNPDAFGPQDSLADRLKAPNVEAPEKADNHLEAVSGLTAITTTDKKKKRKKSSKDLNKSDAPTTSSRDHLGLSLGVSGNVDCAVVGSEFCAISPRTKLDEPLTASIGKETEIDEKNVGDAVGSRVAILSTADNLQASDLTSTPLPLGQKSEKPSLIENYSDQNIGRKDESATPVLEVASLGTFTTKDDGEAAANRHNSELNADEAKGVKSSKQKRKSKKVKPAVEDTLVISGAHHVEGSGIGISSAESLKAVDGEGPDSVIRNVLESLHQNKENEENLEKAEKKSRKKTKRKQTSEGVDGLGLSVQENNAAEEVASVVSINNLKEMVDSSKPLKKADLRIDSAMGKSTRTILELENDTDFQNGDPLLSKKNSEVHDSPQDTMSHKPSVNDKGNPSNQTELCHEKEKADFGDNFDSMQTEHDIVVNDKKLYQVANGTEAAEPRAKSNKKQKKKKIPVLLPEGSIDGSQSSMKLNEKRVSSRRAQPASSSTSQQPLKAKNENAASLQNKDLQNLGTGANDAESHKLDKISKALIPDITNASAAWRDSKKMEVARPASAKGTTNKKEAAKSFSTPANRNNPKDRKKNLFPMAGAIFGNSNSDEDEPKVSGTSTRSPSDDSSDYSDGASDANFLSQKLGSRVFGGEGDGETNGSSGRGDMSLEKILRSSSRFKRAKLIASQSQPDSFDDDESQPFDIVPDSQAK